MNGNMAGWAALCSLTILALTIVDQGLFCATGRQILRWSKRENWVQGTHGLSALLFSLSAIGNVFWVVSGFSKLKTDWFIVIGCGEYVLANLFVLTLMLFLQPARAKHTKIGISLTLIFGLAVFLGLVCGAIRLGDISWLTCWFPIIVALSLGVPGMAHQFVYTIRRGPGKQTLLLMGARTLDSFLWTGYGWLSNQSIVFSACLIMFVLYTTQLILLLSYPEKRNELYAARPAQLAMRIIHRFCN